MQKKPLKEQTWQSRFDPRDPALGQLVLTFTTKGLAALHFANGKSGSPEEPLSAPPAAVQELIEATVTELKKYFAAQATDFSALALDPRGTPFQRKVWQELGRIPCGRTISYQELAKRAGSPRGSRAAGQAVGANPIAVIIPCHRVIASDGSLGGFAGGLPRKRRLLELEGAI